MCWWGGQREGSGVSPTLFSFPSLPPHSPWTSDPTRFKAWLAATPCTGGGRDGPCLAEALAAAGRLFRSPVAAGVPPGDCPRHVLLTALSEPRRALAPWPHAADCGRAPGRAAADEALLGLAARGVGLSVVLPPGASAPNAPPYAKRLAAVFVSAAGGTPGDAASKSLLTAAAVRAPGGGGAGGVVLVSPSWPAGHAALREALDAVASARAGGATASASSDRRGVKRPPPPPDASSPSNEGRSAPPPPPSSSSPSSRWAGPVVMAAPLAARAGAPPPPAGALGAPLFDASLLPSATGAPWPPSIASMPALVIVRVLDAATAAAAARDARPRVAAAPRGRLVVRAGAVPPLGASLLDWLAGGGGGPGAPPRARVVAVAAAPPHALLVTADSARAAGGGGLPVFLLPDDVAARLMGQE